jgi:hypothetical protein
MAIIACTYTKNTSFEEHTWLEVVNLDSVITGSFRTVLAQSGSVERVQMTCEVFQTVDFSEALGS